MKRKSGSNSSNSSFLSKDLADPNLMYMLLFVLDNIATPDGEFVYGEYERLAATNAA